MNSFKKQKQAHRYRTQSKVNKEEGKRDKLGIWE